MNQLTDHDLHETFDDCMNDCEEQVKVCGLTMDPADVLKTMDPVAYRCYFNDWLDGELDDTIFEHADGNYYDEEEETEEVA